MFEGHDYVGWARERPGNVGVVVASCGGDRGVDRDDLRGAAETERGTRAGAEPEMAGIVVALPFLALFLVDVLCAMYAAVSESRVGRTWSLWCATVGAALVAGLGAGGRRVERDAGVLVGDGRRVGRLPRGCASPAAHAGVALARQGPSEAGQASLRRGAARRAAARRRHCLPREPPDAKGARLEDLASAEAGSPSRQPGPRINEMRCQKYVPGCLAGMSERGAMHVAVDRTSPEGPARLAEPGHATGSPAIAGSLWVLRSCQSCFGSR